MELFVEKSLSIFNNPLITLVLLFYLIIATYTDLKYLKIYDKFNISLIVVRVLFIFLPVYNVSLSLDNIIASLSTFVMLLTIAVILMHKMGGDIKFLTAFMLFFDVKFMFIFMAIASVINLIYLLVLKNFLLRKRKKVLEEFGDECKNKKERLNISEKINYGIIRVMMVRQPSVEELISMDETNYKKYRVPFAPFFLVSYLILLIIYHITI